MDQERRTLRVPLSVVFYREGDCWVAHCLELDLLGDGDTQAEALSRLSEAIATQVDWSLERDDASLLFSPAPRELFALFAEGDDVAAGELRVDILQSIPTPPASAGRGGVEFEAPRFRQAPTTGYAGVTAPGV